MSQKEQYVKLKKKYKHLPEWEWINKNFRLKEDDDGGPILEQVRKAIIDKLDIVARSIIEPIIGGGENFCCYFERKMLSPAEKDEMFNHYKVLQALLWRANALGVDFSEKGAVEWIVQVKGDFEKMKPKILDITDKLSKGWRGYKTSEVETSYHG